jgi:hypothetical protein
MELKKYLEDYYFYSGKASDISRQLGFAGIALIWIFRGNDPNEPLVPQELILPGIFLVLGLACDLLQYACGALIWGVFHRIKERKGLSASDELKAPSWLNKPILALFIIKIFAIIVGYVLIFRYLWTLL